MHLNPYPSSFSPWSSYALLTLFVLLVLLVSATTVQAKDTTPLPSRWITYYTDKEPVESFEPYGLCVFDSTNHPPLTPLKQKGKILLGYISLGEVENYRPYYEDVKKEGILSEENPNWKGSFYVDIRDPRWARRVIEDLIPAILQHGFDGIMMDTLDNAEVLEEKYPQQYKGLKQAAIRLVKAIRQNFPTIKIMMNRGFKLLPDLAKTIDMEMAEVIYTRYDFQQKKYFLQPEEAHKYYIQVLKKARNINPNLVIYSLDYWDKSRKNKIKEIYKIQRDYGFYPYVATVDLHQIIPEPGMEDEKTSS